MQIEGNDANPNPAVIRRASGQMKRPAGNGRPGSFLVIGHHLTAAIEAVLAAEPAESRRRRQLIVEAAACAAHRSQSAIKIKA